VGDSITKGQEIADKYRYRMLTDTVLSLSKYIDAAISEARAEERKRVSELEFVVRKYRRVSCAEGDKAWKAYQIKYGL